MIARPAIGFAIAAVAAVALPWPVAAAAAAAISQGTDAEAQLPYWEVADRGVSIRLVQRLPDQTRGFFQARGFAVADADRIASSCVFQTVFKNTAAVSVAATIDYNLRDWVVHVAGTRGGLKTREDWDPEWAARGVTSPARLAFEWSLLPTRQTYRPGDYNWGMTVFDLKPGSEFDLDVAWRENGRARTVRLAGLRCAPDVRVAPADQ